MGRAWGIKLGSGGRCVGFCERHSIVGVGWKPVDPLILRSATRDQLMAHVRQGVGSAPPQSNEGTPSGSSGGSVENARSATTFSTMTLRAKHVRVCRVTSDAEPRSFDLSDPADICTFAASSTPFRPFPSSTSTAPSRDAFSGREVASGRSARSVSSISSRAGYLPRWSALPTLSWHRLINVPV
jgi:hypothetical protein